MVRRLSAGMGVLLFSGLLEFLDRHGAQFALTGREDGEVAFKTGQRQLRDDAAVFLLQQEQPLTVLQSMESLKLTVGETEAIDIVLAPAARVGHVEGVGALLDEQMGDAAVDDVAWALSNKHKNAVLAADR